MEDTPRELLNCNEHSDITKDKFTDTSVTDDDCTDEISNTHTRETTETTTEPVTTDVRRYLQRICQPSDRLIHQNSI